WPRTAASGRSSRCPRRRATTIRLDEYRVNICGRSVGRRSGIRTRKRTSGSGLRSISKKFERSWLNFYREAIRPGKFKTYMICDPAKGGKDKSSNRTSIPVFAAAPGKKLMLVDWALGRFDPDERADHWLRLYRKWKPVRAVYEEYGLVNDSWYLNKRMKDLGFN